ncbi:hypothetical protein NP493_270g03028 [Ridgeia piscesae]|uniref:Uncharacterized protein n=1 Tax=Ridgeia piscesae TaxID=27915 RepID=A0AAD9UCK3_RIDPI|nr:hypothetical protein NP493_270g03028 [Ridgeia piscesae]
MSTSTSSLPYLAGTKSVLLQPRKTPLADGNNNAQLSLKRLSVGCGTTPNSLCCRCSRSVGPVALLLAIMLTGAARAKSPTPEVSSDVDCREGCFDLYMTALINCKPKLAINYPAVKFCQRQCDQQLKSCLVHCG